MPQLDDSPALGSEYSVDSVQADVDYDEKTPFIQGGNAEKSGAVGLFVAADGEEEEVTSEKVEAAPRSSNATVIPPWIISE